MVVICQAVLAWHFATIFLLFDSWKWSQISRLPHNGKSRPFFARVAHDDGRDSPGCCAVANCDHFAEPGSDMGCRLPSNKVLSPIDNRVSVNTHIDLSWTVGFWLDMG